MCMITEFNNSVCGSKNQHIITRKFIMPFFLSPLNTIRTNEVLKPDQ
jgi:hypothetical protein